MIDDSTMSGEKEKDPSSVFYSTCDKFIGKNSEDLMALHVEKIFRLYYMQRGVGDTLSSKLLLKLQKRVIELAEDRQIDINILAFIARIYSETVSQHSPVFDLLA